MSDSFTRNDILSAIASASKTLALRKDEINRLNVFPVPDGDTGTNMVLTIESVVASMAELSPQASNQDMCKAITTGALMGARGNSGVIISQILRGLCEGSASAEALDTASLACAFDCAVDVAFHAVRKPVEGTVLTVLRDVAAQAKRAHKKKLDIREALEALVDEAYASVKRTPDLLPVLKENNVVDAGGYGFAILLDAWVMALLGKQETQLDTTVVAGMTQPKVEIERINDWEGSAYRYCNEFLVQSTTLNPSEALEFLTTMGDCELCVGSAPTFKVHVHSNHPDKVLAYFLERGHIFEVFIHNMQLQSAQRNEDLVAQQRKAEVQPVDQSECIAQTEQVTSALHSKSAIKKPLGFVAVAAGEGNAKILKSLGVDVVVSGGQTMNPSTKDLLDAVKNTSAEAVIILPNNSNIVMTAQSAAQLVDTPCGVVPTTSIPAAFAALLSVDEGASLEDNLAAMTEALAEVKTGEITYAVKDAKDAYANPIKAGDVIGIAEGVIEVVGSDISEVALRILSVLQANEADTCTLLAGEGFSDEALSQLVARIEEAYEDLEIDAHRGDQPLYPVILSVE